MRSKSKLCVAALAAMVLGLPLAEQARADEFYGGSVWDIVGYAIGLGTSIAGAAAGAS